MNRTVLLFVWLVMFVVGAFAGRVLAALGVAALITVGWLLGVWISSMTD